MRVLSKPPISGRASVSWPRDTKESAFDESWSFNDNNFWLSVFEMYRENIQIKKSEIAVRNLQKIFSATFKISGVKGFQAMSLRDLSLESGISMGGLYSYIGSKNDLASMIEGGLRHHIDLVTNNLVEEGLKPLDSLKALIFGALYMMERLSPWYYFCFMELKGLPRDKQEKALEIELRFERFVIDSLKRGEQTHMFKCENPDLLASQVTAQLQQWHLKPWKFKLKKISLPQYADYCYQSLLNGLDRSSV